MSGKQISILKTHLMKYSSQEHAAVLSKPTFKPSLERAAYIAIGRAAAAVGDMPIQIDKIIRHEASLAELQESLPEQALMAICEASDDRFSLTALSIETLTSIIEMQAYGRIAGPQAEKRRPTRADATLSIGFINTLLASLGSETLILPEGALLAGYRYVTHAQDRRSLDLMLDDGFFCVITYEVTFGHCKSRQGKIILALPLDKKTAETPVLPDALEPASVAGTDDVIESPDLTVKRKLSASTCRAAALQAPISLQAVLFRKKISLAELRNLAPGSTISIPKSTLEEARLEAKDGMLLAKGKLGEDEGFHALRVRPIYDVQQQKPQNPIGAEPPIGDLTEPDQFRLHVTNRATEELSIAQKGPDIAG